MTTAVSSNPSQALFESLNTTQKAKTSSAVDDAQTRFLRLLTTQLKNQDPLNPMDNAQMTSQLAQISTVDGIERLNATLGKLIDSQRESQTWQAAALVGHGVLVPGSQMTLTEGAAVGGFELDGPADKVTVEIRDANGLLVRTLELGNQEAGIAAFAWDGATNAGAAAANGSYRFSAAATRGSDSVKADLLNYGTVSGVVRSAGGMSVEVGRYGGFVMSDVKQIF